MRTFRQVIGLWATVAQFADDVGARERTAMSWLQRDSIPGEWFSAVVSAAETRGFDGVTAELLSELAAARRLRKSLAA